MFQGFKEFIMRGSVIELAVAVVIGGAFTAIVNAFVEAIINPLIGAFVPAGDLAAWTITIPGIVTDAELGVGAIISAAINFIAIALVVYFALVMPMNKLAERRAAKQPVEDEPAAATQEELLAEIRDLLAKDRA
ncbi:MULTISPECIES: large conductance mechanosensitive channel protein MscL [unclassified Microbacterium]|uniref:large conductance mechanosensitive channel protein MscL n=1 Tax=unclassified Microbacterium TaxID=2609290 RepID=UPI00097EED39|nr:large conductance mechanosensitive channel protein MscL [Microbacterium sp. JB110]RCS57658.1 large conductance mechanosensitive channel protein MscL [Microbacterium sp. JB110]SJM46095.1 Large-conductance mechanosensitive channel [Frigoribacterium sp. JB110]